MFAKIHPSTTQNILVLTVLQSTCTDDEFEECMALTRAAYLNMPQGFVMVFDLRKMSLLSAQQVTKWMELFNSVRDVTERNLLCTCVVHDSVLLQTAVNLFLMVYDPIKPFHVFTTRDECFNYARSCAPNRGAASHTDADES